MDDVWSKFVIGIFKINGLILQAGEGISQPIGQSSARWQVLGQASESQTVATMARDMGLTRQSVQRVADILAKEGLVIYKDHPTDRRTQLLELTSQGRKVLTAIYIRQVAWSQQVVTELGAKRLAEVARLLEDIEQILEPIVTTDSKKKSKKALKALKEKTS